MATWPATVPLKIIAASFRPQPPVLYARTQFDTGPAFQRGIATAGAWLYPGLQFRLEKSELDDFQQWWDVDLKNGAGSFDFPVPADWPVPGAGWDQTGRITNGYRPTPRSRGIRWTLEIDLELLP